MKSTHLDFAAFVLGGMLVSVPPCMVVVSYLSTSRLEQRPLVQLDRSVVTESRGPRSRWRANPEGGAQGVRSGRSPLAGNVFLDAPEGGDRSLREMATAAAHLCGVPVNLFHALIARESSWRVNARSSAGAIGLAQVMPASARDISPTLDVHDPWQNLVAGSCLLRQYRDRFGSWRVALHAYHGGPTRVDRRRIARSSHAYAQDVMGGVE